MNAGKALRWAIPALCACTLAGCASWNIFGSTPKSASPSVAAATPANVPLQGQTNTHRNVAQEEANRLLVLNFYERFFNQHEVAAAADVIADAYIQHNPYVPDGKDAFVAYFEGYFKEFPQSSVKVVRSAADGDLVYVHVHATSSPADKGEAIVDIFRVEKGRIVEHWDVIQEIPDRAAHSNTMF